MEKSKSGAGEKVKPVPMKLFATWEAVKTRSNSVPRHCSLTLTRLVVIKPPGANQIRLAVKIQPGSKRILRSNDINLDSVTYDVELQLIFSLQYSHFLKGSGNYLRIMVQKKKRYKNRRILGYKTVAVGLINMAHVLQKPIENFELDLINEKSENVVAKVSITSLISQPINYKRFEDEELSPIEDVYSPGTRRNLKQKFVSLLRRLSASEQGRFADKKFSNGESDEEIESILDEFDLSSGGEMESLSMYSMPRPSLRPYFSSTPIKAEKPSKSDVKYKISKKHSSEKRKKKKIKELNY